MQDRSCQLPRSRAVPVPLLWRQDANLSFSWCMPNVAVCVPLSCHRAHPVISAHPAGGPRRKTGNVQTCLSALSANVYNAYIGQVVLTGCFAPPDRGAARDPGSGLASRSLSIEIVPSSESLGPSPRTLRHLDSVLRSAVDSARFRPIVSSAWGQGACRSIGLEAKSNDLRGCRDAPSTLRANAGNRSGLIAGL
jgi:hypothetical protein